MNYILLIYRKENKKEVIRTSWSNLIPTQTEKENITRDSSMNSKSKNSRHSSDMDVDIPKKYKKNKTLVLQKDCWEIIIWIIRKLKSRQNNSWKNQKNESNLDEPDYNIQHSDEGENYNKK